MIESEMHYNEITSAYNNEKHRWDGAWILEIENLDETHLVTRLNIPALAVFDGKLVPTMGEQVQVVFSLNSDSKLERKIVDIMMSPFGACQAKLSMFVADENRPDQMKVASSWIFEGFKPDKIKLQNFDRAGAVSLVDLMVSYSFTSVRIV